MPARPAHSRALPALLALLGIGLAGARYVSARAVQVAATTAGRETSPLPTTDTLNKYCVTCHNSRLKTAGLQLDSLDVDHVAANAPQWEKIVTQASHARDAAAGAAAAGRRHVSRGRGSARNASSTRQRPRRHIRAACPCIG